RRRGRHRLSSRRRKPRRPPCPAALGHEPGEGDTGWRVDHGVIIRPSSGLRLESSCEAPGSLAPGDPAPFPSEPLDPSAPLVDPALAAAPGPSGARGRVTRNTAPPSGRLAAPTEPPWALTMAWTMD